MKNLSWKQEKAIKILKSRLLDGPPEKEMEYARIEEARWAQETEQRIRTYNYPQGLLPIIGWTYHSE